MNKHGNFVFLYIYTKTESMHHKTDKTACALEWKTHFEILFMRINELKFN